MGEMITTNYLLKMQKDIQSKIMTVERQNETFKRNGLYPDYNMDDILESLQEQLESINKCIELADFDYADLYNSTSPEEIMLAEDLIAEENQLLEECEDIGIEELFEDSLESEDENLMIVDSLIKSIENNKAADYLKTIKQSLGVTDEELLKEDERE